MKAKSFARRSPRTRMLKLEPRILFDGALAVDLVAGSQDGSAAHTDANIAPTAAQPDSAPAPQLFALAEHIASAPVSTDAAQQQIVSFLSTASAKDLATIFSGARGEAGANALSAAEALRRASSTAATRSRSNCSTTPRCRAPRALSPARGRTARR